MNLRLFCSPWWSRLVLACLLGVVAAVYLYYRQLFVGACDWYCYFEQSRWLQAGRLTLDWPEAVQWPALLPFGLLVSNGQVVSQYPPGYPLLLALGGGDNAFLVTPWIGVLSSALIYLAARLVAGRWVSLSVAAIWAFCPIVAQSGTMVMSDLAATVGVLAAHVLLARGWWRSSALVLGAAVAVRPTNVLFALVLAWPLWRNGLWWRYALWAAPLAGLYAAYNHVVFGAPWLTGYAAGNMVFSTDVFWGHLTALVREQAVELAVVLPLIVWGAWRLEREQGLLLLGWWAVFLVFYSFWWAGDGAWIWARFVLPGMPALLILAAAGLEGAGQWLRQRYGKTTLGRALPATALLVVAVVGVGWGVALGHAPRGVWSRNKGRVFPQVVAAVESLVPAGACVGSVEYVGAFRLYGHSTPFLVCHDNSVALVEAQLRQGRSVYFLAEPTYSQDAFVRSFVARFVLGPGLPVPAGRGLVLYRLELPPV